ncbi:hypothetical protein ACQP2U_23765 [Nocardia sp. CA-084685]|uniref:hypothetical protein n=1 Tax=Nocardia sp. CA-084685 TaxID=3239970 RepID=UPI003D968011
MIDDSTEMLGGVVPPERLGTLMMSAVALTAYLHEQLTAPRDVAAQSESGASLLEVLACAVDAGEIPHEVAVLNLVQAPVSHRPVR